MWNLILHPEMETKSNLKKGNGAGNLANPKNQKAWRSFRLNGGLEE